MRLAFCNATRRWGGVKTWTVEFAASLRDRGHAPVIYGRQGAFIERAAARGLEAVPVSFGCDFNPLAIRFFLREFRRRNIDAVLVNVGKDLRSAGVAARLAGVPLVQRVGLPGDIEDTPVVRLVHRLLKPRYLCPCRFVRDGMLRALPFVRPEETAVVYSAKTPVAEPPRSAHAPLRLVSSSQINANKGHEELAHTLARLAAEGFAFHWHVAGVGERREFLRSLCERIGLASRVSFHGFLQDVPSLLDACDVFVLSSYVEGLPNALLESMSRGLVPVARAVGGVAECWPAALPDLLVPCAGDEMSRDWAGAAVENMPLYAPLKRLLTASPEHVAAMKRQTWEHCSARFSLLTQARELELFFQGRLGDSGGKKTGHTICL